MRASHSVPVAILSPFSERGPGGLVGGDPALERLLVWTPWLTTGTILLLALLIVGMIVLLMKLRAAKQVIDIQKELVRREAEARRLIEEELRGAHEDLKRRVEERTTELRLANVRLREVIQEREELAAEVRASERRYRLLAETAQDIICIHDLEGRILYLNPAGLIFLGRTEEEVQGQRIARFTPEDHREALERRRKQRASGHWDRFRYETSLVNDAGERMPVEVVSSPLIEAGEVTGILLIARNITAQRAREEVLRASEARYRSIFENTNLGIYRTTPEGRIILANSALVKMLGYDSFEALAERNLEETGFLPHYDRSEFKQRLERDGQILGLESVWTREDGARLYIRENARLVCDTEGRVEYYEGFVEDVTARREAELALKESEERFRSIFDFAPLGIALVDKEGHLLMTNPLFQEMLGYSARQLETMSFPEFTHPDDRGKDLSLYRELYTGERETYSLEKRYLRQSGGVLWAGLTVSIVRDEAGEARYAIGMIEDISERKRVERALQEHAAELEFRVAERTGELRERVEQVETLNRALTNLLEDLQASHRQLEVTSARLRSANAELGEFAYVVSHDLKAPLRAIIQLSDWIQEDYAEVLDAEGREKLDLLGGRARRMHELIEGILAYSRVGRVTEREIMIDLNELVQKTLSSLGPPAHIETAVVCELPTVLGEKTRFRQVFQNLLSNAFKFMDKPRGQVTIDCRDGETHWQFSVADNGPGLAERYHDRIFQMFQTLHSRDHYENTGVGLALVKKIVEGWNGRVWLESEVGKGSTFYFTYPKARDTDEG